LGSFGQTKFYCAIKTTLGNKVVAGSLQELFLLNKDHKLVCSTIHLY
jgi:hypothetical protein